MERRQSLSLKSAMLKGDSKNRTVEGNIQSKGTTLSSSVSKGAYKYPLGADNQSELLENGSLLFKANDGSGERGYQDRRTSDKKPRRVGNGVQDAAAATENDKEGALKKRQRKHPQTRRKRPEKEFVDSNNNVSLGVEDEQYMRKQSQESSQSSGVVERSAARSHTEYVTQAQEDVLSAGEKGETRGNSKPQQRRRHGRKTKTREVVENTNSSVLPDKDGTRKSVVTHTLVLNAGRTENHDETQDITKEKHQRRREERREETENVVHSGDNTIKQNGLQDRATERNGKRQNQAIKSKRRRPPKTGGTASRSSEETTPQKGPQNGATGSESEVVDEKEALKKARRQTKKEDNRSYSEGGVSETTSPINIPKEAAEKGRGKQSGVKKGKEKRPEFKRCGESKKVGKQGNDNDNTGFLKYNEPSELEGKDGTHLQVEGPYESRYTYVSDSNVYTSSQKDPQVGATGKHTGGSKAQTKQSEIQTGAKRREKQSVDQDCLSIKTMEGLLEKSSEEIVHDLTSEHLPLLSKRPKMKDDAVIALIKLFVKACCCKSHADLEKMLSTLQSSWFLTRRLGALLNQLAWKKWQNQQIQVQKLDTVGDILTLVTNVLSRFPNSSSNFLLAKLHKSTMTFVRSGKPLNKSVVVILQDLMKLRMKLKTTGDVLARSRTLRAEVAPNGRPPENFRELSVIPTTLDIVAVGNHNQEPFLRENKVKGGYLNVEHYLDVQFRLLREDFLRPLREGIQLLMTKPGHGRDDRLQDVRVYNNVRILYPACTSSGVRYKVRFDVSEFRRVQWENSKRLTFGSLLCLSKNNFNSFVFASVAERKLHDVRMGLIEVRFLSAPSEDRPRPGDVCTMVESIAFFEAYRPVLEGLQKLSPRDFPFKRYIVDVNCDEDVHPPAYLVKSGGHPVVLDFSPIMPGKEEKASPGRSSPTGLKEGNIHLIKEAAGPNVPVLDLESWPSANDLKLDDSQLKALQLALTKEFAVIQGPPGTGKTFIGLKIAKVLLHNRKAWSPKQKGGPILVVCYTNHALDQFLEGIQDFHPNGIIRVGGRSQSEKIQECSLSKKKQKMIQENLMPKSHRQAFGAIKGEMHELSGVIDHHVQLLEELKSRVFHEDELRQHASNMTSKQYDSLVKSLVCTTEKRGESVIPQWLGLPVLPRDPYQGGFAKPRAMFPFNAECKGLEYFTQEELAIPSKHVRWAPGIDGYPEGSLELQGTSASFIEISNLSDGLLDVKRSITLLAFIYPMGRSGPILSYHVDGLGVQLGYERRDGEIGEFTASFTPRDLVQTAPPLGAPVLRNNEWNFVGASYDHNSGIARLWHNGKEVKANFLVKGLELATQFSIRVGALEGDWEENFSGRISHLHIYNEALTVENIRAVGGISQPFAPGSYSEEDTVVENDEKIHERSCKETENEEEKEGNDQQLNSRGFTFEADALEDQRILETDQVIRFGLRHSDEATSDVNPSGAEARVQSGGFQYQDPRRIRRKIKHIIRKELKKDDKMTSEEATQVEDLWKVSMTDRWRLYRRWVYDARESFYQTIFQFEEMFDAKASELQELRKQEDLEILKKADVVGMTTTGAARNRSLLQDLQPVITIVEEAAEVFEAHTVTSLTPGCQHLILIGDHQQLRPSPTVYDLQIGYYLDVSLFERMVTNGLRFERLCLQHRMRPEIAKMLDHIYVSPKLQNHDSVLKFENVKGVKRNLFFVDHNEREDNVVEGKSKSNVHEAKFLTALCRYFIQQGYQREQITVLTAYVAQLLNLKREMSKEKDFFEGVRVTAVDNFQGEENDIILLSLVRSKRIGFLKIANRVCVALSRARKGFYIIGNAALLSEENPELWGKIIRDMSKDENLGSHLTLVCQNHPHNKVEASSAEDFEKAPEGGCREPCKHSMPDCEHKCQSFCHPIDIEHKDEFVCRMPCARRCDRGHLCRKICSQDCDPCMKKVPKIIPGCGHEQEVPCSIDPSEFRCKQLVQKQASPCGHMNCVECSTEITDIVCRMPCTRTCDRGHNCSKTCSEDCGPCMVKVLKLIPGCNHEQEVSCSIDPSEFKCKQKVRKQASPCGHVNDAECSLAATDIDCLETCGVLKCGHPCQGNCSKCSQGRLHLPCPFPCQRTLFCGHTCKAACARPCPPCSESCSICRQSCSLPCQYIENNEPQCPHHKCTERCANPCGRKRCNNPCQEQLSCGHSCIGICGEVCPKLCRVCNEGAPEFNESERETMFVELVDCGHVFDVKTMDRWMAVPDDKGDEDEIKLKHCPKCNTPVFHSRRYGRKILADFNAVKLQIILSNVASEVQVQEIRNELRNFQSIEMKAHVREIKRSLTNNDVTFQLVSKHQTQVVFLKFLEHLITKYNSTRKLRQELYDRIQFLTKRIIRKRVCFSKQEVTEFTAEVLRTKLLVLLESLEFRPITLSSEDDSILNVIKSVLASGKTIGNQQMKVFMADIKKMKQRHELFEDVEASDSELEMENGVMTKTLAEGPWYRCSKGHVYSACQRIEEEGTVKCPDCVAMAKPTSDPQTEDVVARKPSNQKVTMNPKSVFTSGGARQTRPRRVSRMSPRLSPSFAIKGRVGS